MAPKSTRASAQGKPSKAAKFPLWLHPTGQWACKRRGRYHYFGTDQDKALAEFLKVKDDLEAGRPIRQSAAAADGTTLADLCEHFMRAKETALETGELSRRSFDDYHGTCKEIVKHFGGQIVVAEIRPADLLALKAKWAKKWGVAKLGNEIARTRVVFNFAYGNDLIDKPVKYGEFKKPAKAAYRRRRAEVGPRVFTPAEIKSLLEIANPTMKAMILLGVNAGFGNNDCATLPINAIDWKRGWIDHARPKTGIARRVPLWRETLDALLVVRDTRKPPANPAHASLLFITKRGGAWHHDDEAGRRAPLSAEFRKLLVELGIHRPGASFYTLRHVFQSVAETTGDNIAIKRVMGHADDTMSDTYREHFPDDRLLRVTEAVRAWLFPADSKEGAR
ncbi:MAG: tyrosine-type recombinase/integrase [Pirellulales bacterium]